MTGGITSIQARIAAIQMRFEPPAAVGGGTLGAPATAVSGTSAAGAAEGSFASALSQAMGDGTTSSSLQARGFGLTGSIGTDARTPALRKAPGDYGRLEPPPELVAFGNGKIPTTALAEIGVGNHRLHAPAARAFRQMQAAAKADGIEIGVTDSYRTYESQVDLAKRKGLYSQGGLAATPGTSNHGWGLAVDLDLDAKAQAWMRQHGPDFGFVEDTPREPWHWAYRPAS